MTEDDDVAIRVADLGKMYRLYTSPSDILREMVTRKTRHREHWALQNVNFDVKRGEVVGIIGRNGAGKTTLLRIIAGTLDHTVGKVDVRGRVSAIMVLGTGFNMDLSGRENILLGGLVLGMTHDEVASKTESIIDFSGLKDFIDSPCKEYSSGMVARLAFSIAASVDPDILIVDEALSTGDMIFNAKSYARMREIAKSGATVLFVTHSLQQIYDLCDRAILLNGGSVVASGEPRDIGYRYEQMVHEEMAAVNGAAAPSLEIAVQAPDVERKADIVEGMILDAMSGERTTRMEDGRDYLIKIVVKSKVDIQSLSVGYDIRTHNGSQIYGYSTSVDKIDVGINSGETKEFTFSLTSRMNNGSYFLNLGIAENISGAENPDHYVMIHFIGDSIVFQNATKSLFPGTTNLGSKFIKEGMVDLRPDQSVAE